MGNKIIIALIAAGLLMPLIWWMEKVFGPPPEDPYIQEFRDLHFDRVIGLDRKAARALFEGAAFECQPDPTKPGELEAIIPPPMVCVQTLRQSLLVVERDTVTMEFNNKRKIKTVKADKLLI